jgi:proline iminopeptidase
MKISIGLAIISIIITSCQKQNEIKNVEGFVEVTGGKIWYRVTGKGSKTPILMLHGGPAGTSYYLNPLMDIAKDRPVIMFDQLGCGRSDRITDTTLMTVDSYVDQTRKLLNHLEVKQFYLYGHSWGSILGTEYFLKYRDGIKALILASPILSSKLWATDADTLISTLPDTISTVLRNDLKGISQDSATLGSAMSSYFKSFVARKRPLSADFVKGLSQSGVNVWQYLWGRSEFVITGALKDYDRTNDLGSINIPTLYIIGQFDEVRLNTLKFYQRMTPYSQLIEVKNAGHATMHDNPAGEVKAISDFLVENDKR